MHIKVNLNMNLNSNINNNINNINSYNEKKYFMRNKRKIYSQRKKDLKTIDEINTEKISLNNIYNKSKFEQKLFSNINLLSQKFLLKLNLILLYFYLYEHPLQTMVEIYRNNF